MVNASSGFLARNFLRTDAARMLSENGARIVILAPREKLDYYQKEFSDSYFIFDELPETRNRWAEKFFAFLEHSAIHTKTTYILHRTEFFRQGSCVRFPLRLAVFAARRILSFFGQFGFFRQLIRLAYLYAPSHVFGYYFDKYKPDLVFCPTMVYHDQLILKEAKRRGIKTAGMVLSWDNLYSKSILRVHPDHLLVQTSTTKKDAARYGDYSEERVSVTGIPQYDRYFRHERVAPREEFIKSLGGDPSKKLILYAFSGKAGFDIELGILEILRRAVTAGSFGNNVQVLLRPYPRYDFPEAKLAELKARFGFLTAGAAAHTGGSSNDWEFDERALELLSNSLAHADVIITMYSTFFIEGAIFDKPLIAAAFDGDKKLDYWNSAVRFFEWDHLARMRDLNGIDFARSPEDLIVVIKTALVDPGKFHDGRQKIVAQQCEFMDGRSGERVAKALLSSL